MIMETAIPITEFFNSFIFCFDLSGDRMIINLLNNILNSQNKNIYASRNRTIRCSFGSENDFIYLKDSSIRNKLKLLCYSHKTQKSYNVPNYFNITLLIGYLSFCNKSTRILSLVPTQH